ncbi:MAG: hypothetical protein A2401_02985 [Candidatus Staskawiczbacteria bacterium RIFOXYC1_FULL_38_18]|uniref:Uncharacterized protein n=1 Tax=Candidatus Staskawiczbacteria bacterium RIFOXYC1_FULL_38_18 TaxID=1802229 RepID=A0A1G2JD54_9BACT|nr:MAG: hypothetical protein A2401_02985 [Candidatus Staskawiczbacteria bacterium RIFOXYC1_FULL_38_18]
MRIWIIRSALVVLAIAVIVVIARGCSDNKRVAPATPSADTPATEKPAVSAHKPSVGEEIGRAIAGSGKSAGFKMTLADGTKVEGETEDAANIKVAAEALAKAKNASGAKTAMIVFGDGGAKPSEKAKESSEDLEEKVLRAKDRVKDLAEKVRNADQALQLRIHSLDESGLNAHTKAWRRGQVKQWGETLADYKEKLAKARVEAEAMAE